MTKITTTERLGRATAIGAAGFAMAMAILAYDNSFRGDWSFVRCATGGAFLAGLVFAGGFGGQGGWGWFRAGMAFGAATVLGAMIAVLLLPLDANFVREGYLRMLGGLPEASLAGPIYVVAAMTGHMWIAALWVGAMAIIQTVSQRMPRLLNP